MLCPGLRIPHSLSVFSPISYTPASQPNSSLAGVWPCKSRNGRNYQRAVSRHTRVSLHGHCAWEVTSGCATIFSMRRRCQSLWTERLCQFSVAKFCVVSWVVTKCSRLMQHSGHPSDLRFPGSIGLETTDPRVRHVQVKLVKLLMANRRRSSETRWSYQSHP